MTQRLHWTFDCTHVGQGPLAKLVASRHVDPAVGAHGVGLTLGGQSAIGALVRGAIRVLEENNKACCYSLAF